MLIISCKESTAPVDNDTYTITKNHWMYDSIGKYDTIQHSSELYGRCNFIIDSTNRAYFYTTTPIYSSDCLGLELNPGKTRFINLFPNDLIKVDDKIMDHFIELNIVNDDMDYITKKFNTLAIATPTGTFNSPILTNILTKVSVSKNKPVWIVRPLTQEERIVLKHKTEDRTGAIYNPYLVEWDTTKIYFEKPWPIIP
ncbi:hypothetical protein FUA48_12760 [Flavobacterium alkalisoli]|uniref:Uncharacterized protein n=1 Tax=Flavobacterium alkalisoli TaxID=2602769 RepID=A0A5B9FU71_9FLAO|nr:hypothetical protein [Flavobacterium alkalisoli]QEE50414.1 hypothetical protein FUA48_12760 [Flavobacterium alkalisoli]